MYLPWPMFRDAMYKLDTVVVTMWFQILSHARKVNRCNHRSPTLKSTVNHHRLKFVATGTIEGTKEGEKTITIFDEKPSAIIGESRHSLLWTVMAQSSPVSVDQVLTRWGVKANLQLYCPCQARSNPYAKTQLRTHRTFWQRWKRGKSRT